MPLICHQSVNLSLSNHRERQLPAPRLWANPEGRSCLWDTGASVSTAKVVNPVPQDSQHHGIKVILHFFTTNMLRQRGGERKKNPSVPEPTAGVICASDAKQQAHGFAVLCSQGKQHTARPSFGPLRIHKVASGSCGGHVIPNCVLFNLALQTAKLLLSWLESSVSHLGGAYLFAWIGKLKKSLMLTHVKGF